MKIDTENLEKDWIKYPVLRLDFAGGGFSNPDGLKATLDYYLNEWEKQFGLEKIYEKLGVRFTRIITAAHNQTGKKVVVLID